LRFLVLKRLADRRRGDVIGRQGQGCGVQVMFEAGMSLITSVRALSKKPWPMTRVVQAFFEMNRPNFMRSTRFSLDSIFLI
jgi:hypothetical protein